MPSLCWNILRSDEQRDDCLVSKDTREMLNVAVGVTQGDEAVLLYVPRR